MQPATALLPSDDETRDNAAFEAIMWALSRPGAPRDLPQSGLAAVALSLIDGECRVFLGAKDEVPASIVAGTGATLGPPETADHAIMRLDEAGLADLPRLPAGSQLYPERGATIIAPATIGAGQRLRLSGPGIEGTRDLALGGIAPALWDLRARICAYPLGVELLLVDEARLVALPRSTRIEVL
ncbi:MAG: phosphonate C-P lyase system protein PhnH [Paracoccus sp. (in: a-proteobacteria)]|nr:phosphonate C-P lyase system protein PhnH [Paracoccus sp. (in: a-proteobacteria)]